MRKKTLTRPLPPSFTDEISGVVDVPQCTHCVHFRGEATCAAFPNGIPWSIYSNQRDHRAPYRGDHGIRFEPITTE